MILNITSLFVTFQPKDAACLDGGRACLASSQHHSYASAAGLLNHLQAHTGVSFECRIEDARGNKT